MARRRSVRRAIARTPRPPLEKKRPSGRRTAIIVTTIFVVVIAIVVVVSIYFLVWKDQWRPVLRINDETISMDYLIRRLKYPYKTYDVESMLITITIEEFIRQTAPSYGIEVTPDEVDERLRDSARGENETISEIEFQAWYRDRLNETQLSDAEYRELIETYMLEGRLMEYLTMGVPDTVEQVHLYAIFLSSYDDAEAAVARIEDGEDFSEVARELSFDEESAEQGGDIGWWPYLGGLHEELEYVAFNLEVGQVSEIIGLDDQAQTFAICLVVERQADRPVEEDKLEEVKNRIYQEWLFMELDALDQERFVDDNETRAWIYLQIEKD
ncbi:MAG: peptidylprolyl isomerase [Dehalococcoidales bacterium]|nr:MAG: peptidylprolyl isomerase [Dehalococcoidales bacterium]